MIKIVRLLSGAVLVVVGLSCASHSHRTIPEASLDTARLVGFPANIRIFADSSPDKFVSRIKNIQQQFLSQKSKRQDRIFNSLALSGGAEDGAFGAGLLYGWSETGKRPKFNVVTGISTGAIIAPFAFLGVKYDEQLKHLFTTFSADRIYKIINPIKVLFKSLSIVDTKPLQVNLERNITRQMFNEIALEHRKGRRLLIGTTHFDAERAMIWDIGALANSNNPNALELFRKIIYASTAIPSVFPPVEFEVTANNKTYKELHVDGGVTSQVFLFPSGLDLSKVISKTQTKHNMYIVRNTKITPQYEATKPGIISNAVRSLSTLIKSQGIGDLFRLYLTAKRNGMTYNLAYIPSEFKLKPKEPFDQKYMSALFDYGHKLARKSYPWQHKPPNK